MHAIIDKDENGKLVVAMYHDHVEVACFYVTEVKVAPCCDYIFEEMYRTGEEYDSEYADNTRQV